MKKVTTILTVVLFTFVLTISLSSCCGDDTDRKDTTGIRVNTDDPKENGIAAGEIECELKGLQKEIKENHKKIDRLEWSGDKASEESREAIAELEMANIELYLDLNDLYIEMGKLRNKQWTATEKEYDKNHWNEDFDDAKNDYIKENCKDD